MRLTFLTQWFEPEPPQVRGLPLARALARRGFEVQVVTGFPNYPTGKLYPGYEMRHWQRETLGDVSVIRVPLYPSHDRSSIRRVANYASFAASAGILGPILAKRSDALFVYHPPPSIGAAAAVFRRAWGVPVVYHIADMWPESAVESGMLGKSEFTKGVMTQILGAYCRWVYSECDVITVLSPGFAELLRERGVDSRKIEIIYNWADDDLFKPMEPRAELARELGLAGRFNVVYAGNLGVFQGLESVLRAAVMLRDRPEIQFVFVGTGTEESRLRSLAAQMGADNVRFLGQRPITEMPAINALADVLLIHLRDFPFFRMTIPGKTQISLASGRPVIMAVDGDAADIIRRAAAGLTIPPEQPEALAQAVVRMYETPRDERERIGASGREYYIREMCMDAGADRMARLFLSLPGARSGSWVKTA